MGIEPTCAAWEAAVLPLNYTRVVSANLAQSLTDYKFLKSVLRFSIKAMMASMLFWRSCRSAIELFPTQSRRISSTRVAICATVICFVVST